MDTDVVVVGAGPIGLMLACELRLAGVDVLVVERLTEPDPTIKAGSVNTATAEAFRRRGLLPALHEHQRRNLAAFGRPVAAGAVATLPVGHFAGLMVVAPDVDRSGPDLHGDAPGPVILAVGQQEVEQILGTRAAELGVPVRRGVELTGFDDEGDGVTVHLATAAGTERVRTGWLVGCDGGRSAVRKRAGFAFPGTDPTITGHQAVVEMEGDGDLLRGWNHTPTGLYVHGPRPGRILTVEFDGPPADRDAPITAAEIEAALRHTSGTDVRITAVHSATRFTDNARQADTYRRGRVLLAGDAAHVHSPFGGQGLNLGVGDAVNLGWKLAAVVRGWAPGGLLDTYTAERHPVGEWVLEWTRAQAALMRPDVRTTALRRVVNDLLQTGDGASYLARKLSGVLHRYPGDGPVGRVVPDLALADGTRVAEHLAGGSALLLDLADDPALRAAVGAHTDRIRTVTAACPDEPSLTGLLVRPDGVIAWAAADGTVTGLDAALGTWFGVPAAITG